MSVCSFARGFLPLTPSPLTCDRIMAPMLRFFPAANPPGSLFLFSGSASHVLSPRARSTSSCIDEMGEPSREVSSVKASTTFIPLLRSSLSSRCRRSPRIASGRRKRPRAMASWTWSSEKCASVHDPRLTRSMIMLDTTAGPNPTSARAFLSADSRSRNRLRSSSTLGPAPSPRVVARRRKRRDRRAPPGAPHPSDLVEPDNATFSQSSDDQAPARSRLWSVEQCRAVPGLLKSLQFCRLSSGGGGNLEKSRAPRGACQADPGVRRAPGCAAPLRQGPLAYCLSCRASRSLRTACVCGCGPS